MGNTDGEKKEPCLKCWIISSNSNTTSNIFFQRVSKCKSTSPIAFALAMSLRPIGILPWCALWLSRSLLLVSWSSCTHSLAPLHLCLRILLCFCAGLSLLACQISTQLLPDSSSSTEKGENKRWKSLQVKIKAGRPPSNYSQGKSRLSWGKLVQLIAKENQSRMVRNRKTPSTHPLLLPWLNSTPSFLTFVLSTCAMTGRMGGEWTLWSIHISLCYSFSVLNFIDGQ